MRRAFLLLRIPAETLLGLLCVASTLVLLPWTLQGYFPVALVAGRLGMPRRMASPTPADVEAASRHIDQIFMAVGLLIVTTALLSGLLWFRDVVQLIGRLRKEEH